MADFRLLRSIKIPTERGFVEQRVYDRLAVDFIVHHLVRSSIGALKAGKAPILTPLRKNMRDPVTQRHLRTDD